ncbi:MAG: (Fe-S)-binding protein [Saprospiraceae bacterium]|nr:(Fe-S)-binding protein [Saprospiraceae bacterium]MCB9343862.1 (Fe-S)-binding protein [Lewinellaceae bacterium]
MFAKTIAEYQSEGRSPEIIFWVGCAGSFDARAQKVTKTLCEILQKAGVEFAILGEEERCTGDPARRAGNEFLFQMTASMNIETLNMYGVKKIVTACPHCFNILKNEYPALGGNYEVVHHTQLINDLIKEGKLKLQGGAEFKGKRITYHDSCYLGRANDVYEAPRELLAALDVDLVEMKRSRKNGLCCGAGGAQMWKEDEPGEKRINIERAEEVIGTGANAVAANCPFCITMLQDGLKAKEQNEQVPVYDLSEMILSKMII